MPITSGFFPGAVSGALRAAGQIEQWDETRPSPIGFRHWESGAYKPAAKGSTRLLADGLVGGFTAQKESGVAADFGDVLISDSGFITPTLTLTFNLGEVNSHPDSFFNLMVADGSVNSAFQAFNMRFWLENESAFTSKGYEPQWFYLEQSGWVRNLIMTSGTVGALPMPSSLPTEQNIFVNGTDIFSSGSYVEDEVSNFISVVGHFPVRASGYDLGTYGGLGVGDFQFKMSYEWTGIDATTRATDTQPCVADAVAPTPPVVVDPIASGLQDDVQAYWNLDESSGTRVDSPGSSDLVETGTVGQNATGGPDSGPCALFDGDAGDLLSIADNIVLSVGNRDFTWAGWVYFDDIGQNHTIVGKYSSTGNQREYLLQYNTSLSNLRIVTTENGTSSTFNILTASSPTISATTWYFVVMWFDESAQTISIQVNNGSIDSTGATVSDVFDGTNAFRLSSYIDATGDNLAGRMAKWGIWHKVLSSDEKTTLYNSGAGIDYPFI
ncbi:hypothetical protein KAR91_49990 [Candidatus Pacearchaeota archaeon]|nr:hypothetical protein [Candidatus Pacearchaeota archaeon]